MSFVITTPEMVAAAATDLAGVGSTLGAANAAAAGPTTAVLAAAQDEVSAGIAALFSAHAQQYQQLRQAAAAFHDQFVAALNAGAGAYASAEAANASPLQPLLDALNAPFVALTGQPGAPPPAQAFNIGYGNIGDNNVGFFNTGTLNFGIGNTGYANIGTGNISPNNASIGFGNLGVDNNGVQNIGAWNTGVANTGIGNIGTGNTGLPQYLILPLSLPLGLPLGLLPDLVLFSPLDLGLGNTGNYNQGWFNFGSSNIGFFNTGTGNFGIGVTGNNQFGIGPLSIPR